MQNLAAIVSKEAINQALEEAYSKKLALIPSTKFHIIYKNQNFPPKEIVRLAARKMGIKNIGDYRLVGGLSTNRHLVNKGFTVEEFSKWKTDEKNNSIPKVLDKIARLTYNSNDWQYPSGSVGKSKTDSYENQFGYGHEEWLFDFTKLIKGYKHGFLQPINKYFDKYAGETFNIYLYTINAKTKEKFWIGKLNNVEVLTRVESDKIFGEYEKKGWIQDMRNDLLNLKLSTKGLGDYKGSGLFNVRFKPSDFERYPDKTLITKNETSITSFYYILLNMDNKPLIEQTADGKFILGRCNPSSRHSKTTIKKRFVEKTIEYPFIHHEISKGLEQFLKRDYDNVYAENQTGFKTSIDLVATKGKLTYFYEIKTYNDVRTCIRQAIGQLFEYSYFPDKQLADKIFIVTPHLIADKNLIAYIKTLQDKVNLPISYMCYDMEKKQVTQTI